VFGNNERCIVVLGKLLAGSVDRSIPGMWQVLLLGRVRMIKSAERSRNIAWHRDVAGAIGVIPVKGQTNASGARPVGGAFVLLLEDIE
jgi:hypothetical protein